MKEKDKTNIKDNQSCTSRHTSANGASTKMGWIYGHVASGQSRRDMDDIIFGPLTGKLQLRGRTWVEQPAARTKRWNLN